MFRRILVAVVTAILRRGAIAAEIVDQARRGGSNGRTWLHPLTPVATVGADEQTTYPGPPEAAAAADPAPG